MQENCVSRSSEQTEKLGEHGKVNNEMIMTCHALSSRRNGSHPHLSNLLVSHRLVVQSDSWRCCEVRTHIIFFLWGVWGVLLVLEQLLLLFVLVRCGGLGSRDGAQEANISDCIACCLVR